VVLGEPEHPHLKQLVGFKSPILSVQQEAYHVMGGVISEGGKIVAPLSSGGARWSPYISMYLISKVLSQGSNPDRGDRLAGCACIQAHIAVGFSQLRVNLHPCDSPTINKLVRGAGGNVPHPAMQLHDTQEFDSVHLLLVGDTIQSTLKHSLLSMHGKCTHWEQLGLLYSPKPQYVAPPTTVGQGSAQSAGRSYHFGQHWCDVLERAPCCRSNERETKRRELNRENWGKA
jgi:hypothetical protein